MESSKKRYSVSHLCTLEDHQSDTGMYPLPPDAPWNQRLWRAIRKSLTISERNPRSTEFYRSINGIIAKRREHLETYPYIIHPFSVFRTYYEIFISLVYIGALIFMPLSLAFDYFLSHMKAYKRAEVTMILLCVFDIFMNFITGYADDSAKDAVLSPAKIAKHYIRTLHFFCDTLSTVSLIKFKNYKVSKILDLFGLLRMSRLPTVFEYINDSAEYFKTMRKLFKIVRYSIVTLILFHCVGCLLFLVPQLDSLLIDQESFTYRSHTWIFLYDPNLDKNEIHVVYPFAIFRAVAFLLNIETRLEESTTYSDVLMEAASFIFGKIFFLFMTVVILRLFLSKRSLETKYYEKVNQIEGYMRQKQLPATLQEKILEFYEYKYNRKYFKESDITEMFSDLLKKEINMHVCQDLVNNVNLFEGLPPRSLEDILAQLKVEIFLPNDLIIKAGLYGDCMYFLARGTVAVSAPSGREVCHLEDGAYFGEICLVFRDKKRTANVVALEICEVYRLDKKAFTNIFSKHPELFQKLEVVANERLADTQLVEDSCKQVLFGKLR